MGIESRYNDILTGKNGKIDYSTDRMGYILPNSKNKVTEAKDGKDITLTLDKNSNLFRRYDDNC